METVTGNGRRIGQWRMNCVQNATLFYYTAGNVIDDGRVIVNRVGFPSKTQPSAMIADECTHTTIYSSTVHEVLLYCCTAQ